MDEFVAAAAALAPHPRVVLLAQAVPALGAAGLHSMAVRCADAIAATVRADFADLQLAEVVDTCLAQGQVNLATAVAAQVTDPLWRPTCPAGPARPPRSACAPGIEN